MLSNVIKEEIQAKVKEGPKATLNWINSLREDVDSLDPGDFSGEIIDKRPDERRMDLPPLDISGAFDNSSDLFDGDFLEIDPGISKRPTLWKRVKKLVNRLFGVKEKTEEEVIEELLLEYSPLGDYHKTISEEEVDFKTPKNIIENLDVIRAALNYTDSIILIASPEWEDVQDAITEVRALLSKNLGTKRNISIDKGAGLAIEVEAEKTVEYTKSDLKRALAYARNTRD